MSNSTSRSRRASVLLVGLAVLLGASCSDENPTSPPAGPAATHLRFMLQPADAFVDTWSLEDHALLDEEIGFSRGTGIVVQVEVLDERENRVVSSTDAITISLAANPGSATLYSFTGTTTQHAVDGVAQFALTLDRAGSGYALEASADGLEGAISNAFRVTFPPAANLGFLVQPNSARVDTWSQATHEALGFLAATVVTVSIEILDEMGFRATSATDAVTLALSSDSGGALHSIFGATVNAVDGIAVFELTIDRAGSGYSLTATADGLTGASSDTFAITDETGPTGVHLAFFRQPNNAKVDTWSLEDHALLDESIGILHSTLVYANVEILSAAGQRITSATDAIALALDANPGGGSLYSFGETTLSAVGGVAAFEFTIDESGSGYTVAASGVGLTGATSNGFTIHE